MKFVKIWIAKFLWCDVYCQIVFVMSLFHNLFNCQKLCFSQLYVGLRKCTVTALVALPMAIPIFSCKKTCDDKFDIMLTPFSALEFIIERYINDV